MKKSIKTYILAIAVFVIWGLIAFKIYSALNQEDLVSTESAPQAISFNPISVQDTISYVLQLNYRDPFLGKPFVKKQLQPKKLSIKKSVNQPIVFPDIHYNGLIAPKTKGTAPIYMIVINGKQYLFSKNETKEAVKLLRGNSHQIEIQFQGHKNQYQLEE